MEKMMSQNSDKNPEFVMGIWEFTYFNIFLTNPHDGAEFYTKVADFFTNHCIEIEKGYSWKTLEEVGKSLNTMYLILSSYLTSSPAILRNQNYLDIFSKLFKISWDFYLKIFDDWEADPEIMNDEEEVRVQKVYLKLFTDFFIRSSNEALLLKFPDIHKDIPKEIQERFNYLTLYWCNSHHELLAKYIGCLLMSNSLLLNKELGRGYFSILGDPRYIRDKRSMAKDIFGVFKFFRSKEGLSSSKKNDATSLAQFFSVFILMILNEYSISRELKENNDKFLHTITKKEMEIVKDHIKEYVWWNKILNVFVEYYRTIQNKAVREREISIFIKAFFHICKNTGGVEPTIMACLRFKKVLTNSQLIAIADYLKKCADKIDLKGLKEPLNILIEGLTNGSKDNFGKFLDLNDDESIAASQREGEEDNKNMIEEGKSSKSYNEVKEEVNYSFFITPFLLIIIAEKEWNVKWEWRIWIWTIKPIWNRE